MPVSFRLFFFFVAILITVVVRTFASIFYYYSITMSLISIKPCTRFEDHCLGYPLANFQLLMISSLPCS